MRQEIQPHSFFLKPGYLIVNVEETVVRAVLGNCVAVTMFDAENAFGGMSHFLYPASPGRSRATTQYANIAIPTLFQLLRQNGANPEKIQAQIFGGSTHPEQGDLTLGPENIATARRMLKRLRIPVVDEDVGGHRGRKLIFHTGTNEVVIMKVDNIRASDWIETSSPYTGR